MKLPGEYKLLDQIQNTADLILSDRSIDRIIGQDHAVDIVKLASMQRRFLLIAGEPGTGKSMLGRAAADMMKTNFLNDVIAYENSENKNLPEISIAGAGSAVKQIQLELKAGRKELFAESFLIYSAMAALAFISGYFSFRDQNFVWIFAASIGVYFLWKLRIRLHRNSEMGIPKILVNREPSGKTPFIDATGSGEGALLGDVRHDPYQSGGMETPPHQLLEAGAIHHADGGVLYIDEISMLSRDSQQSLLTAIQDKKMPITGRSPGSSGMMIRSEPVPCDFMLVLAGNLEDIEKIHPALRSRIKGYGYEIYTKTSMPVNPKNTEKMIHFIAGEVQNDGRIPHFEKSGIIEILNQAVIRARPGFYTLRLRELGGLIRTAGDVAAREKVKFVNETHVIQALEYTKSIESAFQEEEEV